MRINSKGMFFGRANLHVGMREAMNSLAAAPLSFPPVSIFRIQLCTILQYVCDQKCEVFNETNRYATQYLEREREHLDTHPNARAHEWRKQQLTINKIDAFIALPIAMGICGFPILS